MKKITKIIVDADIARCVSEKLIPVSTNSRALLNAMLENRLVFIRNEQLRREWKYHASSFATKWLSSMTSRRLVVDTESSDEYSNLLDGMALSDKEKQAGKKDCHLISAAKNSEAVIASNDVTAFAIFQKAAGFNGEFGTIHWLSPTRNIDEFKKLLMKNGGIPKTWLINCAEHHCIDDDK